MFYEERYIKILRLIFELDESNIEEIKMRTMVLRQEAENGLEDPHKISADLERKKRK